MVHSPSHEKRIDFVDWSNTWSKQGDYDRHISFKERLAAYSDGTQKRPFALVVTVRPLAHDVHYFAKLVHPHDVT